jgi:hypothetical protein
MDVSTESLERYGKALRAVEEQVVDLLARPLDETLESLTDFERAKLRIIIAYAITALQICHLRAKGESDQGHPCRRQLDRLKAFFTKVDRFADSEAK